jgi:hypothetical protein
MSPNGSGRNSAALSSKPKPDANPMINLILFFFMAYTAYKAEQAEALNTLPPA